MFGKNKKTIEIDGKFYAVDPAVAAKFHALNGEINSLEWSVKSLKTELQCVKPVMEDKKLKSITSEHCRECRFAVCSTWNGEALKCLKGVVCDDFEPSKEV